MGADTWQKPCFMVLQPNTDLIVNDEHATMSTFEWEYLRSDRIIDGNIFSWGIGLSYILQKTNKPKLPSIILDANSDSCFYDSKLFNCNLE